MRQGGLARTPKSLMAPSHQVPLNLYIHTEKGGEENRRIYKVLVLISAIPLLMWS